MGDPIVIVDRRTSFERDRTWCFWEVGATPLAALASKRWSRWSIATDAGQTTRSTATHPYLCLDAADFYAHALSRLARAPNVELRLGERVTSISDRGTGVEVVTSAGRRTASVVYDGLGDGSPLVRGRPRGDVELAQHFLGQVVRASRPAFDPSTCMLMDFRVDQSDGMHFVYLLPFSTTEALVEDTYVSAGSVPAGRRQAAVASYLRERHGLDAFDVLHSERGRIGLTTHRFPLAHGPRIHAIGSAAGAVRPSTGYAFLRIQRHCAALAAAVASGRPAPRTLAPARYAALDRVFLRALIRDPGAFPERFRTLLARTPPETFARFMTDASTPVDDLRVIAALPVLPFVSAALTPARTPAPRRSGVPA